ncbi:hypothetical protein Scep_022119 [Stephania cephalantha]|uniref:Uncharacterized protein n=1 Tax=Stephania cephalantha TaxID=152367 RepID=A0AAP0F7C1_9MAGN
MATLTLHAAANQEGRPPSPLSSLHSPPRAVRFQKLIEDMVLIATSKNDCDPNLE